MRPLGYLYKQVAVRPEWIKARNVVDIYSLSGCVSQNFSDYIQYWMHNGFWLFDSPRVMEDLAAKHSISLEGMKLFYYEAHEQEFDEEHQRWVAFEAEASFSTNVLKPANKTLEGFDVTSFSVHTSPECSPLSCNSCAEALPTNSHCLFHTFEDATHAIESGAFVGSEPGPYRVIAVYSANDV